MENSEKIRPPSGARIFSEFSKHLIYHVFVVSSLIYPFEIRWENTPYGYLLGIVKIKTLVQRRKFQALVLVYRWMNNQAPSCIQDFLNTKICNYNLRGSDTLLMLPNFNLEWRHRLFSFLGAKKRNPSPPHVREAKNVLTLKLS